MARKQDKPDIPPGTPFQRVRPMLITFFVVAALGPMLFSSYWLNTFSTVACLVLGVAAIAAVGTLSQSITEGLRRDARVLNGGDIAVALSQRSVNAAERAALTASVGNKCSPARTPTLDFHSSRLSRLS